MKIADINIHICQHSSLMGKEQLKGQKSELEFLVIRIMTDEGVEGCSFGLQCELHTTIYHPLELANLHCACAMKKCEFFELLWPIDMYNFGLAEDILIDDEGYAHVPSGPGMGIDLDWGLIDNATVEIL